MKSTILHKIPTECSWRNTLYWYDTIDSTNTRAKAMAREGAPQGTLVIAGQQTGGRGRMGRGFHSPEGAGAYLSVILRPGCTPDQLMHLTCAVGVAMVEAIRNAVGIEADLKWINDLVWAHKKLGGILTELAIDPKTGLVDYAVVGVGINCRQQAGEFPPEIANIATSLSIAVGKPVETEDMIAEMVLSLYRLAPRLLAEKADLIRTYRDRCVTLGRPVQVLRGQEIFSGQAVDMDDDGRLVVTFSDGHTETVNSGEVSVRGFYGYV